MNNNTADLNNPFMKVEGSSKKPMPPDSAQFNNARAGRRGSPMGCFSFIVMIFLATMLGIFFFKGGFKDKFFIKSDDNKAKASDVKKNDKKHEKKLFNIKAKQNNKKETTNTHQCTPESCIYDKLAYIGEQVTTLNDKVLASKLSNAELKDVRNQIEALETDLNSLDIKALDAWDFSTDSDFCLIKDKDKYIASYSEEIRKNIYDLKKDIGRLLGDIDGISNDDNIIQTTNTKPQKHTVFNKKKYNTNNKNKVVVAKSVSPNVKKQKSYWDDGDRFDRKFEFEKLITYWNKDYKQITPTSPLQPASPSNKNKNSQKLIAQNNYNNTSNSSSSNTVAFDGGSVCPRGYVSDFVGGCYLAPRHSYECSTGYYLGRDNMCHRG